MRITSRGDNRGTLTFNALHTTRPERVHALVAHPALADGLSGQRRERAVYASAADVLRCAPGRWDAAEAAEAVRGGLGLLVVDGMLVRRVGIGDRYGAELLGPGDLLQPTEHDGEDASLPFEATWRVISPVPLAVLDLSWMARMAPYPEVTATIVRSVLLRSRRLATMAAITQHHRLEDRLHLLFWELADRYGRVGRDGVILHLDGLTHDLLSHLVGAHRPSVSAALSRLSTRGLIERSGRRWLLRGGPPALEGLIAPDGTQRV